MTDTVNRTRMVVHSEEDRTVEAEVVNPNSERLRRSCCFLGSVTTTMTEVLRPHGPASPTLPGSVINSNITCL